MTELVTHDVRRFILRRPEDFSFEPGQGVEIALDQEGWREEGRPFTPTSLVGDGVLEFTIKAYPEHDGVTERLHRLGAGEALLMSEAFGTITYRGPGVFVAGGAGVTPFLSILRRLAADDALAGHSLLFSNKTRADVICEKELRFYLGDGCHLTLTGDEAPGYDHQRIDREYLSRVVDDFGQRFYVCGPPAFVDDLKAALVELGASPDGLVFEE
jgi:cytochrome-b5 reductase